MSQEETLLSQSTLSRARRKGLSQIASERLAGIVFAMPWLLHLLLLTLLPVLASLYFSFCHYQIVKPPQFSGLHNYVTLFTEDKLYIKSLGNTLFMVVFGVPIQTVAGLCIALLLNTNIKGRAIYRTMYYLPSQVSGVAFAMLWGWILNPQYGVVKIVLEKFGIKAPLWLHDPNWVKPSFILMGLWGVGGAMIVWLAGLQAIPEVFYEAAEIDGANRWRRFWSITLPLLSPTLFFVITTAVIRTFQIFSQAYILTQGGPIDASLFYALYLYRQAFQYFRMGYASAMAWVLFVIIMSLTLIQVRLGQRWVYYEAVRR